MFSGWVDLIGEGQVLCEQCLVEVFKVENVIMFDEVFRCFYQVIKLVGKFKNLFGLFKDLLLVQMCGLLLGSYVVDDEILC